jgi:hypothetical protein
MKSNLLTRRQLLQAALRSGCLISVPMSASAAAEQVVSSTLVSVTESADRTFMCEVDGVTVSLSCVDARTELAAALSAASGKPGTRPWGVCGLSAAAARAGRMPRELRVLPEALAATGIDSAAHSCTLMESSLEVWISGGFQGATNGECNGLWCVAAGQLRFVPLSGTLALHVRSLDDDAWRESRIAAEGPLWIERQLPEAEEAALRDAVHAGHGRIRRRP